MLTPDANYGRTAANLSDRIFMELMKDSDPVDGIVRLYDEAVNKREFVLALAAALLVRHRQWQCAASQYAERMPDMKRDYRCDFPTRKDRPMDETKFAEPRNKQDNKPWRKCHDCGKPTHNYRCRACWAKLRRMLGLPIQTNNWDEDSDGGAECGY